MRNWLRWKRHDFGMWIERRQLDAAWLMPRWLVKWCFIRVVSDATTGEYGSTVVPELTAMDALKRFTSIQGIR